MGGWHPCCGDGELILIHYDSRTGDTVEKVEFGKHADKSWKTVVLGDKRPGQYNAAENASGWRYWIGGDDFLPEITREYTYPEDYPDVWFQGPYAGTTWKAPAPFSLIDAKVNDRSEIYILVYCDSTFFDPESPFPYQYFVQVLSVKDGTYIRTIKLRETYSGGGTPSHYGCHMPYGWWSDYDADGWPLPSPYPPQSGGPRTYHYQLSAELVLGDNRIAINAPYVHIDYRVNIRDRGPGVDYLLENPYVQMWDMEGNLKTQIDRSDYHVFPSDNPNNDWAAMPLGCGYHQTRRTGSNFLVEGQETPDSYYPIVFNAESNYNDAPVPQDTNARQPAVFDSSDNLYFIGGVDEWDYTEDSAPVQYLGVDDAWGSSAQHCYNYSRHWDGKLENAATCYSSSGSKTWDYTAETTLSGRLFAVGIKIHPNTGNPQVLIRQNLFDRPVCEWLECKRDTQSRDYSGTGFGDGGRLGRRDWQAGPSMFYIDFERTHRNGGNEDGGYYLFQEPDNEAGTPAPGSTIGGLTLQDQRIYKRTEYYNEHDQELHNVVDGNFSGLKLLNFSQRAQYFRGHSEGVRRTWTYTVPPYWRLYPDIDGGDGSFHRIKSGERDEPVYGADWRLPQSTTATLLGTACAEYPGNEEVFGVRPSQPGLCMGVHMLEINVTGDIFLFGGILSPFNQTGTLEEKKYDSRQTLMDLDSYALVPTDETGETVTAIASNPLIGQAFKPDRMYTLRTQRVPGTIDASGIFEYDTSAGQFKLISALNIHPPIQPLTGSGYVHYLHPLTGSNTGPFK